MAWGLVGAKPLSEPMMDDHWRICASLGLNELMTKARIIIVYISTVEKQLKCNVAHHTYRAIIITT